MNFSGRHIIVTGASTGIGFATARALGRRGAHVTMLARRQQPLDEAVASLRQDGGSALAIAVDVSDRQALIAALDQARAMYGPAAGLFANAASGGGFGPLHDYPDEDFEQVMRTNVSSIFWTLKQILPEMAARGKGSIVITGSLASERGIAGNIAYAVAKHGVIGLAKAAAAEVASKGVRINCVLPGLIATPMLNSLDSGGDSEAMMRALARAVPQHRIGMPDEVAEMVCFLLSDDASHITAQSIAVDGGMLGTFAFG